MSSKFPGFTTVDLIEMHRIGKGLANQIAQKWCTIYDLDWAGSVKLDCPENQGTVSV